VATILATDVSGKAVGIILACLMLMGALLLLGIGIWYVRRWQRGEADSSAPWTFDDLRKLRDQGNLTEDEYQTLRAEIIGMYTGEAKPGGPSAPQRAKPEQEQNEDWDWVAEDEPGSDGFDVKKRSPD
jgi:hypothetical protein